MTCNHLIECTGTLEDLSLTLNVAAQPAAVPPALEALERLLESAGAGAEECSEVRLMAEEVLMNIVAYADAGDTPGAIRLQCLCSPDHLRLEFRDSGRPFNPLEVPSPDLRAPLEQRALGGLGIHLIRALADAISYDNSEGCNRLMLIRRRRQE